MHRGGDAQCFLGAGKGLLHGDGDILPQIGATAGLLTLAATAGELAENIGEHILKTARAALATAATALEGSMAVTIIGGALFPILEDVVSLIGFLELALSGGVALVAVRVVLHGEFAIGALEVIVSRVALDAEHFVVVTFSHGSPLKKASGE